MISDFAAMYEFQIKQAVEEKNEKQRIQHQFITDNTKKKERNILNFFSEGIAGKQRMVRQWAIDNKKTHATYCMPSIGLAEIQSIIGKTKEIEVVIIDTKEVENEVMDLLKSSKFHIIIFCTNHFIEDSSVSNFEVSSEEEFMFASDM